MSKSGALRSNKARIETPIATTHIQTLTPYSKFSSLWSHSRHCPSPSTITKTQRYTSSRLDCHLRHSPVMASITKASPNKQDFRMPMPPPPLLTRNSQDTPRTPNGNNVYISPVQTPQGSPSKQQLPPGAHDLPNVFDNAMKLMPTAGNPNWSSKETGSPTRAGRAPLTEDRGNSDFRSSVIVEKGLPTPGSPNKENAPPVQQRSDKGLQHTSSAAASRREPYSQRAQDTSPTRNAAKGLSADALERLQKPAVRRLANVTQLCEPQLGGLVLCLLTR